ncbi:MAG: hypothetical protein J7K75_04170 [Desulfuromonas sp.]|nr:hypothetical protein [Desulfuromonas sp.]
MHEKQEIFDLIAAGENSRVDFDDFVHVTVGKASVKMGSVAGKTLDD